MIEIKNHQIILKIYVVPGSSQEMIVGEFDQHIKIKIKGQAVDGQANESLINFLKQLFQISAQKIHLISGHTARRKKIIIEMDELISRDEVMKKIGLAF